MRLLPDNNWNMLISVVFFMLGVHSNSTIIFNNIIERNMMCAMLGPI
jgi:hypothetical protein